MFVVESSDHDSADLDTEPAGAAAASAMGFRSSFKPAGSHASSFKPAVEAVVEEMPTEESSGAADDCMVAPTTMNASSDSAAGAEDVAERRSRACLQQHEEMTALVVAVAAAVRGDWTATAGSTTDHIGLPDDLMAEAEGPGEIHADAVLAAVARALPRAAPGERVPVPGSPEPVVLSRVPTRGELGALRRAFAACPAGKATEGRGLHEHAAAAFARFLTIALQA